ncbi:hypothetical protein IV203_025714 [Nitzschia inconspicua]|uniref:Uncharacterized protein n=1 Tax=Nitzschia inconspicua TaxID=303405 RepID=A0A9K3LHE2_9STRA|nr:hypothetical protein IV203_025714 [Nitzschia inconspicua]
MKIGLAFCLIYSLATTVVDVHGVLRGEKLSEIPRALKDKSSDKEDEVTEADVVIDTTKCRHIPVEVREDGSQTNFATLYAGLYGWGETSGVNPKKLCDSFVAAYTYLAPCTAIPGAFRTVDKCSVVPDATGPDEDAFLLKLTYFANTVNGAQLFEFEDPNPSCFCDRCPGLDPFPGIYQVGENGPMCTCYCDVLSEDLHNTACTCRSPVIAQLVDVLNVAYKDDDFYFLDARQLVIDSTCTAGTNTTFDDTFICLGE